MSSRQKKPKAVTPRIRPRIFDVLAVVLLLAISLVPLWPIYEHPAICWLAGIGLVVGVAVALIGARWPGYAVVALAVIAYALIGVPLAIPSLAFADVLPTPQGLRELATGTVTAWQEMLTAQVPLGTYESLMVPALVVVLVASVSGVSIAVRAKRAGWAVLAPLGALSFGILFGSSAALWPALTGVALVLVALAWATLRADPIRTPTGFAGTRRRVSPSTIRRYVAAVLLVSVCGAAAVAVDSAWPTTDRTVLRSYVTPPIDVRDLLSPLIGYRNNVLPPDSERVHFTAEGLPDGTRVRLATLDAYNGMVFAVGTDESSGTFERVPYRIDRDDHAGAPARVTMTITDLDGPWLPTVGDLVDVAFTSDPRLTDRFYYNSTAASAALLGGLSPTTYTMNVLVEPMPSLETLATMRPGPDHQSAASTVPEALVDAAKEHGVGESPGERLVALVDWLRTGYVSHGSDDEVPSRPGHSAERLGLLFTEDPMLGDAEQYATAMALLAREVGFPSRVVVGYAPQPGQTEVTGAEMTAWVEVQVADGRWMGLDPNPEVRDVPIEDVVQPEYVALPESVLPPPPPSDDDPVTRQNEDGDHDDDPEDEPGWWVAVLAVLAWVGLGVGVIALLTLPIWVLALVAAIRRRRRRRRDRRRGVVTGAWNEVRDAMIDRGYGIEPAATRREVAELSDSDVIRDLADRADRGVFGGEGFTPLDVKGFWARIRPARRSLDAGTTRRDRLRRIVTLQSSRSLRRSWEAVRRSRGKVGS